VKKEPNATTKIARAICENNALESKRVRTTMIPVKVKPANNAQIFTRLPLYERLPP
jgi:hypothetical protein